MKNTCWKKIVCDALIMTRKNPQSLKKVHCLPFKEGNKLRFKENFVKFNEYKAKKNSKYRKKARIYPKQLKR